MTIIKRLAKYLGLLLLAIIIVALFLPAKSTAQRSIDIAAPPATVFTLLDGFQRFNEFSPWFQYDPTAEYSWSGPTTGVGARMSWKSTNPKVGNGSQEVIALAPNKSVTTRLQFDAPGKAQARWLLEPIEAGTRVTWALDSDAGWNLIGRWFGVFLDRMMAADFATGLSRLKAVAEADAAKPKLPAASIETLQDVAALDYAYVSGRTTLDNPQLVSDMNAQYARIGEFLQAHSLAAAGPVGAITRRLTDKEWVYEAFIPLAGEAAARQRAAKAGGEIKLAATLSGRMVKAVHIGPYENMQPTYDKLASYLQANKLTARGVSWEQYLSDPGNTPAEQLVSYIYQPVE